MEGINLIAHNDLKNPATEAYRVIRTSIQFAQAGKELKTLAVTSCIPNEGKSMTAANLAVVLTQAGKSVLLLDCDMRNPTVHKNFGLSNKLGLSSCISMGTPPGYEGGQPVCGDKRRDSAEPERAAGQRADAGAAAGGQRDL